MSIHRIHPLPSVAEIVAQYPVTAEHRIEEMRQAVRDIISGSDKRLLMIGGPCSAYPFDAVREFADFFAALQDEVREKILLVLRCYIQKPRTTLGWPGPLNQPDPNKEPDVVAGIHACNQLMSNVGKQLPIADEMLFTHNEGVFGRWLSYTALGARSTEDTEHRFVASGIDMALGVKNTTDGNIRKGVDGVECIQHPHDFSLHGHAVRTSGNPFAHLILRGGENAPNCDPRSIAEAHRALEDRKVKNPAMIIDASHDNCRNGNGDKDPLLQEPVVKNVLSGIREQRGEYGHVRGFMFEGFLKRGKQKISPSMDMSGLSITDPCLSTEDVRRLVLHAAGAI